MKTWEERLADEPMQSQACSPVTRWLGQHPLFLDVHRHPALLLHELAWRWGSGGLLLLLAGFEAWRIWAASLPDLRGTGLLLLTPDSLLADPGQLAQDVFAAFDILRPPVERAALGLTPLLIFCWVLAFAWGRTGVLARFDGRLPRRPWMLAESEALRVTGLLAIAAAWIGLIDAAHWLMFRSEDGHVLLYICLIAAITYGSSRLGDRFRRTMHIGTALAVVENTSLLHALARAWLMGKHTSLVPLRRAVGRIRFYLFLAAIPLAFVPAPFHFGWALGAWWLLFTLPPLAAADAWRLGAFFALVRVFQVVEPETGKTRP